MITYLERKRNLEAPEIYDQVVTIKKQAENYYKMPLSNIVFMGMGEPLLNYQNVIKSVELITSEKGLGMSPRRITISTAGIAKMIKKLGDDQVKFANFCSNSTDNIEFINPELNTRKFYRTIDLLLFLSFAPEGMPLVVLEAISFDVGVISYPLAGVVEILGDGYPLYVENEKEVVRVIKKYFSNDFDRKALSNIHSNCAAKFNFDKMINSLKQIYEQ